MGEFVHIDALGPRGSYRARDRKQLTTLSGIEIGEISQVPPLYVRRALTAMRKAPKLPAAERFAVLERAAEVFTEAEIGGHGPDEYPRLVSVASGVPLAVVRQSVQWVADVLREQRATLELAIPKGAVADWQDRRTLDGCAVWTRKGAATRPRAPVG
ncbi:hypothetical protein [Nocardia sp. NPDC004260]